MWLNLLRRPVSTSFRRERGTVVTIANKEVALFNVEGTVYAMENACLHQRQSLGSSPLDGCVVTCRAHGWRYNVTTGQTLHVPDYGLQTYPVKLVDGTIRSRW